jgi:hypothetical protein
MIRESSPIPAAVGKPILQVTRDLHMKLTTDIPDILLASPLPALL